MLLCVDVGNTQTVLAVFDSGEPSASVRHSWRVRTDRHMTADELALLYRGLLGAEEAAVSGIAVCSTVPAIQQELRIMMAANFPNVPSVIVAPGAKTGVKLAVDNPKEVGTDRVMNTLAAFELFGGPAVVVDFGTSTNFDVVGRMGEFLGGALAPGLEVSVEALASRAAQLRTVELSIPRSVIGRNTVESLQSGIVYGVVGQVDGIVARIAKEIGAPRAVIATGGLAPLVIGECETITHHEPYLTLRGLQIAFHKREEPKR